MGKLVGGIALLFVSAFMALGFLVGGGADSPVAARIAAFVIAVLLPGAGGAGLLYLHRKGAPLGMGAARERLRKQTLESEVVKLAQQKGGKLTVVEVVAETAIGAGEAEAVLQSLAEHGLAEPEVTDSGLIVYSFYDVQKLGEKKDSRGLLDA